ncbi:unnamed protein product [Withania somnifera]
MSDNSCNSRHFSWLMKSCFPNNQHPSPHHPTPIVPLTSTNTISSLPDDLLLECLSRVTHSELPSLPLVCSRWSHILDSPAFHLLRQRHRLLRLTLFAVSVSEGTLFVASCGLENACSWKISSVNDTFFENGSRLSAIGRKIYVIGRTAMLRYDTWTGKVVGLQGPVYPRKKFATAVVGGKIYVAGGCSTAAAVVEEYDPSSNKWLVVANVPKKRYGCVGASVDGIFYIIGGLKLGGGPLNEMPRGSAHVYASSMNFYDSVNGVPPGGGASSMLMARESHIYASSMDLYDTVNGVWLKSRSVPGGGCVIAACAAAGEIYILSSHASSGFGEWRRIKPPPLPAQVRIESRVRFSCVGVGEKVVLVQVNGCIDDLLWRSGRVERGMKEGLVLVYDCCGGEWSRGVDLPEGIRRPACVCVEC